MKPTMIILSLSLCFNQLSHGQGKVEISGSLTITNNGENAPPEGTIRFNPVTKDFEGFNGFYWVSLTRGITFETGTVMDIDGNIYLTVKIDNQWWMGENINVGTRIEGTVTQTNNSTIEKYCFGDVESNCDTYGGLYLWSEMMQYSIIEGSQGICPEGWHIPTDAEWTQLILHLDPSANTDYNNLGVQSSIAGGKMKEIATGHWADPNVGATNESTFTALPGGYHDPDGTYNFLGNTGFWWTSSLDISQAWLRYVYNYQEFIFRNKNSSPGIGYSVRCVKD